jgi:predicted TIM-barrel fold metal-dependent hydrolase
MQRRRQKFYCLQRYGLIFNYIVMKATAQLNIQKAIDIHSHHVLTEYLKFLDKHGAALEETFPLPKWDATAHVQFMDKAGAEWAMLTMPAPHPYFGDGSESSSFIRSFNEASAKVKAAFPGRFKVCASLPLPDVEAAIKEAIYVLDVLHADGIKLASNSRGQYIGDATLDPLMEVLNQRHAVIIVHPHGPALVSEGIINNTPLAMYEYPAETTRGIVNMISRNVPARYPNIKVVVPHCGSFLPMAIPRMKSILPVMVAKGLMQNIDWEGNLQRLYYDLAGSPEPEVIKMLLSITTPEHIMYGSDYPYLPDEILLKNKNRLQEALAKDEELSKYADAIMWGNACRLFDR